MKQSILLILIILALLLTACGAPAPSEPEAPEAPAPVETAAPEPEPEPESEPEPEPEHESNLIGISMPNDVSWHNYEHEGQMMNEQLLALGYEVDLEFAANDSYTQCHQIETMIENGAKVLIITAIDGEALGNVLDTAKEAGVKVISYDWLLMGSDAVSYYCTFGNAAIGRSFGQYILDALDLAHADGKTYNIEYFCGDPGDGNAVIFFHPGMELLVPYIDSGTLTTPSGQTSYMDCTIEGWDTEKACERMEQLLDEYYSDGKNLDAVYCANDSVALGVEQALETSYYGSTYPIITGQDCGLENVKNILAGKQAMSAFKLTDDLAAAAAEMADAIMKGEEPPINDREMYDNGTGIIPTYLVAPRIVTIDNLKEMLIDSGYYTPEQIGIDLLTEAGIEIP